MSPVRLAAMLTFLCVALGVATPAWAAEGRVINRTTGQPIAGAEVLIVGQPGSVRTDADGRFEWDPDPRTPFEVVVILPGGQLTRPILIEEVDWAAVLTIEVTALMAEEIQVTAGLAPSVDATPAAGMTLLSGGEISRRTPQNLNQALENVAGVSQVSEGQAAVPAIRGLAGGRTLILIDGARVTAERRAGPSATFLDPSSVEGVDVARGPGSVAYGSDAFGGVISVRTQRPEPNSPFRARLNTTLGTGVPDRRVSFAASRGHNGGAVLLQGRFRRADDYDGPERAVLNSGWRDHGFLARVSHQVAGGMFSFGVQSDYGRDIERPRNNSDTVRFYYPIEDSLRITSSFETVEAGTFDQLKLSAFWGTYEQRTDQDRFASAGTPRSIERSDLFAKDFSVRAAAEKSVDSVNLEFGIDVNGRYGLEAHEIGVFLDDTGTVAAITDFLSVDSARKTDTGVFAQASVPIASAVSATAGLRFDRVTTRNIGGFFGDQSSDNSALSGFGALTVGPFEGVSVTAQFARGFREARLSDRYFRGPTGRGFITGNPDLGAETSKQFDLAVRYTSGPARIAAYVFHYEFDNLIERFEADEDFFFFRNRGSARVRGVELEAQLSLGKYAVEVAGHIERGVARDEVGGDLDDMPADSLRVVVRRGFGERGSAFGRFATFADQDRPGPNERFAPGYTLLDAGVSWRLSDRLELRGLARNLLNSTYHASPVRRFVLAPGRNASVTVVVSF